MTPGEAKKLAAEVLFGDEKHPPEVSTVTRRPPDRIGGHLIKRRVASGGMGIVYEAAQEHPSRTVALKVLSHGMTSSRARQRFDYEVDVLGRLQHPTIAQIYEAGTFDDGQRELPYFVMEFVSGAKPITTFADDNHLTIRARVELLAMVCEGVQHGHQKSVIHRDLKPSNILVDDHGRPKIIDFGVARATDSDIAVTTRRADCRELIGTLQYMSPEQCAGDPYRIDTRTDLYSLGVILYELLCGKPPFAFSDTPLPHAVRQIQGEEPRPPSVFRRVLRGDLDAIVLTAMEKHPARRYPSAEALADDLRRHLRGEPIRAKKPGVWTRGSQWIGRHPTMTTSLTCGIMLLCTVATSFGWIWHIRTDPFRIALSDDGRRATLLSRAERELGSWEATVERGITFVKLLKNTPHGDLALVGFGHSSNNPYPGQLCAFDAEDPEGPAVWQVRVAANEIIEDLADIDAGGFGVQRGRVIDIFPSLPGEEIIAVFQHHPRSPAVIRIHGASGQRLYEVWHDGSISSMMWLPDVNRLVFTGHNSEVTWRQRGQRGMTSPHPRVVFALDPVVGYIADRLITPSVGGDMTTVPWYYCLLEPAQADDFDIVEVREDPGGIRGIVRLRSCLRSNPDAVLTWSIDGNGQEVPDSRGVNDLYRLAEDAPEPGAVFLGELPPIVEAASGPEEN